ncbi:MAG: TonB-dependent receptor [Bacteroidetes bacterium]|nr:MAG: TonB-dependent receptor [Bacteroidota bacterium]REK06621.1 MAG: TonB-dependent receptor [Bacteroidota bacterium]REK33387.1 MAG: TonB-dependent receptor [Bacteroidota bacterium]REK49786.1 MAG: TonB-dependent receptor [Bacteroidota bacterium]
MEKIRYKLISSVSFRLIRRTIQSIAIMLICIGSYHDAKSQVLIRGKVVEISEKGTEQGLAGANVYWIPGLQATVTDASGEFKIDAPSELPLTLVISFVGFKNDTIRVGDNKFIKVSLEKTIDLSAVEIQARQEATVVSTIQPINVEKITQQELQKAACCNLSESFETSPTVNVAYKDAVTGAKEIQMLGLAGRYTQIMTENIPTNRGIGGVYGLTFIPGPWMESIQVTKGSGSVANGYESTTGQINIEYLKPDVIETPRFHLNLFGETNGNMEINSYLKKRFNDKWSSMLFVHGNYMDKEMDHNHDQFLDIPTGNQINIGNRWRYHSRKKLESQFGFNILSDVREGGQTKDAHIHSSNGLYRTKVENRRAEVYGKLGFIYPDKLFKSLGNIIKAEVHDLQTKFGLRNYDAVQSSLQLQSIYQNTFRKTNHQYKIGLSYLYENLDQNLLTEFWTYTEHVPGLFTEYTYNHIDKFTLIAGLRQDHHSQFGWVTTPRLHMKYSFSEYFIARASAGRGFRVPYMIADNISVLASSKALDLLDKVQPERAWNYGLNATKKFSLFNRESSLSADFYRTVFSDQLIMDPYSDSSRILFYNLDGQSFANSFQATFNISLMHNLELRLAYKSDDVKITYKGQGLIRKPLVAKERALMNLAFKTGNDLWKLDYTLIMEGKKRLPLTFEDAEIGALPDYSPQFYIMHLQLTKVFRKFEIYGGVENLLDYTQDNPVINPQNPFSTDFDASVIWGPIDGRRVYAGLRYNIY